MTDLKLKLNVRKAKNGYMGFITSNDSPVKLDYGIIRTNKRDAWQDSFKLLNETRENLYINVVCDDDISLLAMNQGITNVGQLSKLEIASLERFVKRGVLLKVEDNTFPQYKTRYVYNPYFGIGE